MPERRTGPLTSGEIRRIRASGESVAIIYRPESPPKNKAEAIASVFAQLWLSVQIGKK